MELLGQMRLLEQMGLLGGCYLGQYLMGQLRVDSDEFRLGGREFNRALKGTYGPARDLLLIAQLLIGTAKIISILKSVKTAHNCASRDKQETFYS